MPNSGYPTPDAFEGDAEFICIPIIVPNKTEFKAAIYGLYGQMANDWFWKQFGTMSPETAAFLSSRGLAATEAYGECGDTMTCEQVEDCIEEALTIDPETNEPANPTFYNFITNVVNNTGFGDPNSVNAETTTIKDRQPSSFNTDAPATLANCDLNSLWAWLRHGVVERLDDNARDMLEDLAALNDLPQRYQAFIDIVPILGDVAEAIATAATEVIPDLLNAYNSYSSESVKDEIACELFSLVCSECRYPTYKEIFDYYASLGYDVGEMDAITTVNMVAALAAVVGGAPPAQLVYHTMIVFQLFVLYMGATFNGVSGTQAIANYGTLGEDYANDNWIQLCNSCTEQWQIIEFDFTQSPSNWKLAPQIGSGGFGGQWVAGLGFKWTNNSSGDWAVIVYDVEPQWRLRGAGFNYTGVINAANSGISFRPTPGTNTGVVNLSLSTGTVYNRSNCLLTVNQGFRQVQMGINKGDANPAYIEKAFLIFDAGYGTGSRAASRAIC